MADRLLELTVAVVGSYLGYNRVSPDDLPGVIRSVYASLRGADAPAPEPSHQTEQLTAAQIKRSIRPEALISFEDGKPYRTLKRHLARMGLTPAEYRVKWGLPVDYPMAAPEYSAKRSAMAKQAGLGQRRPAKARQVVKAPKTAPR